MKSVSRSDLYGCCFFCGQCEKLYNLLYILKVLSITFKHYFTLLCCLKYSIVNKLILVIIDNINVFIFGFICVLQSVHIFLKVKSRLVLRTDSVFSLSHLNHHIPRAESFICLFGVCKCHLTVIWALLFIWCPQWVEPIRFMVFKATFNNFSYIMAASFIGEGNPSTQRKPLTCHKTTNFIT